jgi:hypothetical protein
MKESSSMFCFIYHVEIFQIMGSLAMLLVLLGKKNLVNKNQGWEPTHQKYKTNVNTSIHNPKKKNKSKQSTKIK